MRRLLCIIFAIVLVLGGLGAELRREEPASCCCTGEPVAPLASTCPCGMPVRPATPCRSGAEAGASLVLAAPAVAEAAVPAEAAPREGRWVGRWAPDFIGDAAARLHLRIQALDTGPPERPLGFLARIGSFLN